MIPRSMRARLTLGLALLIVLCLGMFAAYAYVAVAGALNDDLDRTLRVQAEQIAATSDFVVPEFGGAIVAQPSELGVVDQVAKAGIMVEVFDLRGRVTERSDYLGPRLLATPAGAMGLARQPAHAYTQQVRGGTLRIYSLPARQNRHLVGVVLVAATLRGVAATAQAVLVLLVMGGLGAAALTVLGSSLLVRRGLRPLGEMAVVAESINARRLDQRLQLHGSPREVERLALTFNAMLDRLHDAFAAQHRFVADASHELRTPLAIFRGRSEVLLLNPRLDEEIRRGLATLHDEAKHMGRLVENLLLLARGDGLVVDRQPVELDGLVLAAAQHARELASNDPVRRLTVTIRHEDRAVVGGDEDLLMHLLLNLVDNAVAYTPAGGGVEVALYAADGWARLSVSDSGPGIAPEHLERIFELFYRLDHARSRRSGGAGLGLAIARWVAEAHGGRIEVDSVVGRGSTFTLVLPLLATFGVAPGAAPPPLQAPGVL